MKKITWIMLLIFFTVCGYAQTYKIQKAYAFVTIFTQGRAPTDENGRRMNPIPITERFIYIGTNYRGKPVIDSVLYNSELFAGTITEIKETKHNAGIKKVSGQPVIISSKKGNNLWRLDLQDVNGKTSLQPGVKKIIIKGKLGTTNFRYFLNTEIELSSPDRY